MNNKEQIKRLRDNAELAWATYGYFNFLGKRFIDKDSYGNKKDTIITCTDILDMTSKDMGLKIQVGCLIISLMVICLPTKQKDFLKDMNC
ncbi:hypothetical protein [Helicobacter saguini]|uniref:hypothetical protein n=1 Tax=Helicobacter saguini TaxID=1548018 RepID=UPI00068FAC8A|nr:hypothetical protein [Helicobacter saguini]